MNEGLAIGAGVASYIVAYNVAHKIANRSKIRHAVCVFDASHSNGVEGFVTMVAKGKMTEFECSISHLSPGKHGFHIHASGDLRQGCKSACDHYNPTNATHGDRVGSARHRGDLGNIVADAEGRCIQKITAEVTLDEIVGRTLIIHDDEDDLGLANNAESRKTGNAGKRLACGVIGRMR